MNPILQALNNGTQGARQPDISAQISQVKTMLNGQDPKSFVMNYIKQNNIPEDRLRSLVDQTNAYFNK